VQLTREDMTPYILSDIDLLAQLACISAVAGALVAATTAGVADTLIELRDRRGLHAKSRANRGRPAAAPGGEAEMTPTNPNGPTQRGR
jgi:hypothetical protein